MEKKNKCVKVGFSTISWTVMAILLCAVPCIAERVDGELNLGTDYPRSEILNDWLDVYGTLNMHPGAYVDWGIYAFGGSTVNIYAGTIGTGYAIMVLEGNPSADPPIPDAAVTVHGKAFFLNKVELVPIPEQVTFTDGSGTLTVTYDDDTTADLLFSSDIPINLVDTAASGPEEITIDIKPGSDTNTINLGSQGVIPVAILTTAELDATTLNAENIFLAGSGLRVRGKGNKYLSSEEDVNGDGLIDLVLKVETENLDPGQFAEGGAYLRVHETSDPTSAVLYEGWDEIVIVPPE